MTVAVHPRSRVRQPWGFVVLGMSSGPVSVSNNNVDDTTQKILGTLTIPGGTMRETSMLRIWSWWTYPSSANGKVLAQRFNASSLGQTTVTTTTNVILCGYIYNKNSLTQQRGPNAIQGGGGSANSNTPISISADTKIDVNVTWTANWSANVSPIGSETIVLEKWLVELFY